MFVEVWIAELVEVAVDVGVEEFVRVKVGVAERVNVDVGTAGVCDGLAVMVAKGEFVLVGDAELVEAGVLVGVGAVTVLITRYCLVKRYESTSSDGANHMFFEVPPSPYVE